MTQSPTLTANRDRISARPSRAFLTDTRASTGIMFALLFVPAFGLIACAIDYSRAISVRTALLSAADNATFAGIGSTTEGYKAAMAMTADGHVTLSETDAAAYFENQVGTIKDIKSYTKTVSVVKAGGSLTSTVSFTAQLNSSFGAIVGITTHNISGKASAANSIPVFQDFYLMLDDSPSMGVAATAADIINLQNLTKNTPDGACAFACHDLNAAAGKSNYDIAKANSITTRIDVLRQATTQLFTTATNLRSDPKQFGMGIHTFDIGLNKLSDVTTDMTSAATDAAKIDLMGVRRTDANFAQDTDFNSSIQAMNSLLPTPGTGITVNSRQEVVFLVTDGVADFNIGTGGNAGGGRQIEAFNQTKCQPIKDRGIKIAVLYTPYLPLPTNGYYNTHVKSLAEKPNAVTDSAVTAALKGCATDGMFFEVSPTQGIADAMSALFQKVVGMAHLTK